MTLPRGGQEGGLTAARVLVGLRLDEAQARRLYEQGVRAMEESSVYQLILEEGEATGEAKGVRATILRLGCKRFGPPMAASEAALQAMTELERLGRISERVLDAADWQDLLATP